MPGLAIADDGMAKATNKAKTDTSIFFIISLSILYFNAKIGNLSHTIHHLHEQNERH